jgi:hypothetical protein
LLLIVPIIFLSFILSSLLTVSLSGLRRIVLASDLFFRCTKFLVTGLSGPQTRHIYLIPDISDLRPNISGTAVLTV